MGSTALWCVANSALNVLQKLAAEAYMRTQPEHSWNDNNLVAHLFLYHNAIQIIMFIQHVVFKR